MMLTVYRCEKCGKEFTSWGECYDHEKHHIVPFDVVGAKDYDPWDDGLPYPKRVLVEMSNGDKVEYIIDYKSIKRKTTEEVA